MNHSYFLQQISRYLPQDRLRAVASDYKLPYDAFGSALFADISGFTSLTEALAQTYGLQRGAEELSRYLNQIYALLITEVDNYGGSVINFSGDAITCWFDNTREIKCTPDEKLSSLHATSCALAMQQIMYDFPPAIVPQCKPVPLAVKIAIATGKVQRFIAGDPIIQCFDVLAGETLFRMAQGECLAFNGEVLIDATTAKLLTDSVSIIEWRIAPNTNYSFGVIQDQQPLIPVSCVQVAPSFALLNADTIHPWILLPIYERLQCGLSEFMTELRPTVALFLQFSGIDFDATDAENTLDTYIRWVQSIVSHYAGVVLDLTIGDKGCYLYANFGALIAHEDDAKRAVFAALELRTGNLITKIGISRGTMRVGAYGGLSRHTFGAIGDEVNLAARLMQAAKPKEILVSGRIRYAVGTVCTWEELPALRIKGKREPIPVVRILDRVAESKTRPSLQPPPTRGGGVATLPLCGGESMVGRLSELNELIDAIHAVETGNKRLILIEGEAGIGKSILIETFKRNVIERNLSIWLGNGDAIETTIPYFAWRSIVTKLLKLDHWEITDQNYERAWQSWSTKLNSLFADQNLIPLLNPFLPFSLPDTPFTAELNGQARQEKTNELLVNLLQDAIHSQLGVVIIDDAHWLDSASWILIQQVNEKITPLCLILALRPMGESLPPEYVTLRNLPNTRHILLHPLPEADIHALLCARLKANNLPPSIVHFIRTKAECHPFFSEELAYAIRDSGLLKIQNGEILAAPNAHELTELSFPDTIQGVIISRIDRLNPYQQLTLKVASVIGRIFAFQILQELYPISGDRPNLSTYLNLFEQRDLTLLETPEPNLTYIFKHIITQEVAYQLIPFVQRCELHKATATFYEKYFSSQKDFYHSILAYHWERAEIWEHAVHHHRLAGEVAARLFANQEARQHFAAALAALTHLPTTIENQRAKVDIYLKYLDVAFLILVPKETLATLESFIAMVNNLSPPGMIAVEDSMRLAFIHFAMGRAYSLSNNQKQSYEHINQSLQIGKAIGNEMLTALALGGLGIVTAINGQLAPSQDFLQQALPLLEKTGNWPYWILAKSYLGYNQVVSGKRNEGLRHFEDTLMFSRKRGNLTGQAQTLCLLALGYVQTGELQEIFSTCQQAIDLCAKSEEPLIIYIIHLALMWAYIQLKQFDQARVESEAAKRIETQFHAQIFFSDLFAAVELELILACDGPEAAVQAAKTVIDMAEASGNDMVKDIAQRNLAGIGSV